MWHELWRVREGIREERYSWGKRWAGISIRQETKSRSPSPERNQTEAPAEKHKVGSERLGNVSFFCLWKEGGVNKHSRAPLLLKAL